MRVQREPTPRRGAGRGWWYRAAPGARAQGPRARGPLLLGAAALLLGLATGVWLHARAGMGLAAAVYSLRGRVVAVDPGHGGIDPGAIGPGGLNEDTINLAVSLDLAAMLERAGAIVVLTRTGDNDRAGGEQGGPAARKRVDLRARVALVRAAGAEVVVSVHGNHFSNAAEHGAQVFYDARQGSESKLLATVLQAQLARITGETRRRISEHIDHYILAHSAVPGATVEIGFLSNPREARLLADSAYQHRVAYAIFTGLALWFARLPSAATAPSSPHPQTASSP